MATSLAAIMAAEEKGVYVYGELIKAKTAEVNSLTEAIEAKTKKIGDLGVAIVQLKDDIDDTSDALAEDKVFLKELSKGCDTKAAEWEERKRTRAAELLALAETIKMLNDDDALELFKKTLPTPSLLQTTAQSKDLRRRALTALEGARRQHDSRLSLVAMALRGSSQSVDRTGRSKAP